ncbi:MFS transporter [Alteromonas gracilis]
MTARTAVTLSFAVNGFALASWLARVPETRERLGVSNGELGVLLLALSIASVLGLPLAGGLVDRFGATRVVRAGTIGVVLGTLGIAFGVTSVTVPLVVAAMALYGLGTAVWDVAMNVEGAEVERRVGRTIMPIFHAAFSVGTVTGALAGAGVIALGLPMVAHLGAVALMVLGIGWISAGRFLPVHAAHENEAVDAVPSRSAWTEPRTLLIGLMVLALALTEGTANDWLALALKDGYGAPESLAVLGFAGFVSAMTIGRLLGSRLLDRFGRVRVLYGTIGLALAGVLILVFGQHPAAAVVGILLWGFGASLGFPVGMSAAADDPRRAAARVSVVSTVGYTAFLAGPPFIGFVGDRVGTLDSMLVVALLLVPSALLVPAAREQKPAAIESTR